MSDLKADDRLSNLPPEKQHELAENLDKYTDPSSPDYDPAFAKRVREARPDWFKDEE